MASATEIYTIPTAYVAPASYERRPDELLRLKRYPELGRIDIFDHAHNDYLQAVAELGLPAAGTLLMALLMLWGLCLRGAVTRRRRRLCPLVASATGVLVAPHAVTDSSLLMPAVILIFAVILGIGCAQSRAS